MNKVNLHRHKANFCQIWKSITTMIWIFSFKNWIDLNVQDGRILILYSKYSQGHFGGKNAPEIFCSLEEPINNFMSTYKEAKTAYQVYEKDGWVDFILVIITWYWWLECIKRYMFLIMLIFPFFFCYFGTIVVLKFFEFIPKILIWN